jgi:hypothetical protein
MSFAGTGLDYAEIRVKGKSINVPSARIDSRTVVVIGNWLKVAAVQDEELMQGGVVDDPDQFITALRKNGVKADLFTFAQHLPDVRPKYRYHLEWESAAVIPITTFREWLEKRVEYDVRKALRKASKLGLVVAPTQFDDAFVHGVCCIYNESTVRQGKPFWHYGKNFETVKREASTYLDRSEFIGAYYQNELVGFIKMIYVDGIARTVHVISQQKHSDKKPTNALIAKAVEVCEQKGRSHLVYGEYAYGESAYQRIHTSKTEFKRRNGFEEVLVPRYYIPLTVKGRIFLKLGLHRGIKAALPRPVLRTLRTARSTFYKYALPRNNSTPGRENGGSGQGADAP